MVRTLWTELIMVSDSEMGAEGESAEEDMGGEEEEGKSSEDTSYGAESTDESSGQEGMSSEGMESQAVTKAKSKSGGRRAALRILRENVDSLSKDIASF